MTTENSFANGVAGVVVQAGVIGSIVLPDCPEPALGGLPPRTPTFVGRDEELQRAQALLDPSKGEDYASPVVVSGIPGVGKTELLLQVAHTALAQAGWFPGGTLFVDLRGYDARQRLSPKRALGSLLEALGVPAEHIPARRDDRCRLYRSALAALAEAGRRVLVVLDNVRGDQQLQHLLPGDAGSRVLISSRETLAELDAVRLTLPQLSSSAGNDLLRQVLRLSDPQDNRVDAESGEAQRIATLCGGLPLALRVLAGLLVDTPARPLSDLRQELSSAHSRLKVLSRENIAVRAAFDLSYRRLTTEEARFFRLLSLPPGNDFATETAARTAGVDRSSSTVVLTKLARMHLVEQGEAWGRWHMHDLMRDYSVDLMSDEEGTEAFVRLFTYLTARLRESVSHFHEVGDDAPEQWPDGLSSAEWLNQECMSLVEATVRVHLAKNPLLTLTIAGDLAPYLWERHHLDDAQQTCLLGIAASRELGERRQEAMVLSNLGLVLKDQRKLKKSVRAHKAARQIARELRDTRLEALALNHLGLTRYEQRRFAESLRLHRRAARLFKGAGDSRNRTGALLNAAETLRDMGRPQQASALLQKAHKGFLRQGNAHGSTQAQGSLALTLRQAGRAAEAIALHRQAIAQARTLHRPRTLAVELSNYGCSLTVEGQYTEAEEALQEALALFEEMGDRSGEARTRGNLAGARLQQADWHAALNDQVLACELFADIGDDHALAVELRNAGHTLLQLGRHFEALENFETAAHLFSALEDEENARVADDLAREVTERHGI
ncbi:tetratricopeptide repeat protein [Streptomyces sp. DR3-1]|uniref:tetratricopeptide repeat protein n=1 Tax=Streptomyces sp. DR3-1 TaxID=2951169 RepID=UPI002042FCAE|nr:tetratricopeptide repeat protein [Streptomyces sp. DR3-1]MCM3821626.1 tetratricopeptide repeat protein [Streptomyces sp. DR3-1]